MCCFDGFFSQQPQAPDTAHKQSSALGTSSVHSAPLFPGQPEGSTPSAPHAQPPEGMACGSPGFRGIPCSSKTDAFSLTWPKSRDRPHPGKPHPRGPYRRMGMRTPPELLTVSAHGSWCLSQPCFSIFTSRQLTSLPVITKMTCDNPGKVPAAPFLPPAPHIN